LNRQLRAQEHYRLWIADAIIPVNSLKETMFSWTFRRWKKDAKHKIVAPLSLTLTKFLMKWRRISHT